jgi:rhodanese-related sulfurtransferase
LAQKAAKKFASLGYPVRELVGGYEGWVEGKFPVESGASQ